MVAFLMAQADIASYLIRIPKEFEILSIFIAGLCFVSVFTIAPSVVVLGQLAVENSLPLVVIVGGIGALCGDYLIFRFFRDRIFNDVNYLRSLSPIRRITKIPYLGISRWIFIVVGALIIASPFPDEVGLAMMGLTKVNMRVFVPLSFILNAAGILVIGLIARAV